VPKSENEDESAAKAEGHKASEKLSSEKEHKPGPSVPKASRSKSKVRAPMRSTGALRARSRPMRGTLSDCAVCKDWTELLRNADSYLQGKGRAAAEPTTHAGVPVITFEDPLVTAYARVRARKGRRK